MIRSLSSNGPRLVPSNVSGATLKPAPVLVRALHRSESRPAPNPLGALSRFGYARDADDLLASAQHLTDVADEGNSALFPIWEDLDAVGSMAWAQPVAASGLLSPTDLEYSGEATWAADGDWADVGELLSYEDARALLVADRTAPRPPWRRAASSPAQGPVPVQSTRTCAPPARRPPSRTAVPRDQTKDASSPERDLPAGPPASAQVHLDSNISPYFPPPIRPRSHSVAAHPDPQPHHFPLVSRYDWRLSSPLVAPRPSNSLREPPPLNIVEPRAHQKTGVNRLVGIGLDSAREGARWQGSKDERWGWKVRVPQSETTVWTSADAYRSRPDRLIALSRKADEKQYLIGLSLLGTPEHRESLGRCIPRATGASLGSASTPGSATGNQVGAAQTGKTGSRVGVWKKADGVRVDPDDFPAFVPQPPPSDPPEWLQGNVLEIKDGALVVAFDEDTHWPIEDGAEYRIDIGLDDTGYKLQQRSLDNLYFDPAQQRKRNAGHVLGAQHAFYSGTVPGLREWSLQGTSLRELLVPDLDGEVDVLSRPLAAADDSSPAVEVAHLEPWTACIDGIPSAPLAQVEGTPANPSTVFRENQLINSWIARHRRQPPLEMPGDPEMNLNPSQKNAVAMALSERLSLIQGPPGTGKSQTIVTIISLLKSHFRIPTPILLAGPTHVSTDHLLSLAVQSGLNPLRLGRASRVQEGLQQWTVEKRRESHPMWARLEVVRSECEACRLKWVEAREGNLSSKSKQSLLAQAERTQKLHDEYRVSWRRFVWTEQRLHASLLATADVMIDFPIVFLDEAAMCTEPVSLLPLMKGCEHATLIGDHLQLPAVVQSHVAKRERLHESLFERLSKEKTVKSVLLDTQYRMRPDISAFPNLAFYRSALKDSESVRCRSRPLISTYLGNTSESSTALRSTVFLTHSHPEEPYRRSTVNRAEIDMVVSIVGDLLFRNPALRAADIGVISPYAAQTRLLREEFGGDRRCLAEESLRALLGPSRASEVGQVEVNTVDGFQGREKTVIILSTVRSNRRGQIGFLTDRRRLNVALTRAQDALFVLGNATTLEAAVTNDWLGADQDAEAGLWRRYLGWMRERGLVRAWTQRE